MPEAGRLCWRVSLPSVAKDPEQDFACEDSISHILCGEGQGEEKPRNPKYFLVQPIRVAQEDAPCPLSAVVIPRQPPNALHRRPARGILVKGL
jgi:hypothetical protein